MIRLTYDCDIQAVEFCNVFCNICPGVVPSPHLFQLQLRQCLPILCLSLRCQIIGKHIHVALPYHHTAINALLTIGDGLLFSSQKPSPPFCYHIKKSSRRFPPEGPRTSVDIRVLYCSQIPCKMSGGLYASLPSYDSCNNRNRQLYEVI